jgi:hypothetical protein
MKLGGGGVRHLVDSLPRLRGDDYAAMPAVVCLDVERIVQPNDDLVPHPTSIGHGRHPSTFDGGGIAIRTQPPLVVASKDLRPAGACAAGVASRATCVRVTFDSSVPSNHSV